MVPRQPKDNSTRGPSEVKSVEAIDSPYHADIIQPLTFTWWGVGAYIGQGSQGYEHKTTGCMHRASVKHTSTE